MGHPQVSFFTNGNRRSHNNSYIIVDQVYVDFKPPVTNTQDALTPSVPVLFIHGGGLTGAMWEATHDRRPGWAVIATQPPYSRAVYCMDTVDSGRSQRCPDDYRDAAIEHRTAAEMHDRFRLMPAADETGAGHANDEYQFPMEHFDSLVAAQSARRRGNVQYEAEAQGIRDVISEIGTCDIIAHSNGCSTLITALLDEQIRSQVRRLVMVEPAPALTPSLDHLQSIKTLTVWGDHIETHYDWPRIKNGYSGLRGDVTVYDLPKMGIMGNSHFPMHDRNSAQVADMVFTWLKEP